MAFAYVDVATNKINVILQWDTENPQIPPPPNPGEIVIGAPPEATIEDYYYDGAAIVPFPKIPMPTISESGHRLDWANPPAGLHAKVYDPYVVPPHLIADTDLTGPDCALYLVQGGERYVVELTASFPFQPLMLEVDV